jgi:hypothetical protein
MFVNNIQFQNLFYVNYCFKCRAQIFVQHKVLTKCSWVFGVGTQNNKPFDFYQEIIFYSVAVFQMNGEEGKLRTPKCHLN